MLGLIGKKGSNWTIVLLLLFGVLSESLPDHHHDDHSCVEDEGEHFEVLVEDQCEGNEHQHDAQVVGLDEDSHEHDQCALCQLAHFYIDRPEPPYFGPVRANEAIVWLHVSHDSVFNNLLPRGPPKRA